ncbi:MAG: RluA family pseudouridine synthase [Candidatus Levybacteria bacterium]|nr:RluA family pseudouridine synthase [Candidatus Levybacteria bacterium]
MEIKILYEDHDILVLDKPSGVVVNRSDTTKGERTVQDWVEDKFSIFNFQFSIDEESDFYKRAGIVHRLDKETSGILIVAKTPDSFDNLQSQFKERKVKKTYLALVHGKIEKNEGEINVSVGRLPWNRRRFGVVAGGREAVTKYKVLSIMYYVSGKNREPLSLLELYPKTGRTHQIRVHLKYINHPVFADPLYAGRKTSKVDRKLLSRIFLHASKISFYHPKNGKMISFESNLPQELQDFISRLSSVVN